MRSDCYKETIIKVALIKRVVAQRRCSLDGNLPFRRFIDTRGSCIFVVSLIDNDYCVQVSSSS